MTLILNVGCGNIKKEDKDKNTIYLDSQNFDNIDIVRDIEKGLPYDDKKFDMIIAHHIIEHVKDLIFVMNEFHRCLKKEGILDIIVPFGICTWIDPTHVRAIDEQGLNFFMIKDFNSTNAGVKGFFKPKIVEYMGVTKNEPKGRALHFKLQKIEQEN